MVTRLDASRISETTVIASWDRVRSIASSSGITCDEAGGGRQVSWPLRKMELNNHVEEGRVGHEGAVGIKFQLLPLEV